MKNKLNTLVLGALALTLISCSTPFERYQKQAQAGNAEAQVALGLLYLKGSEDVTKDREKALEWFGAAAKQGNVEALCNLGDTYKDYFDFGGYEPGSDEHKYYASVAERAYGPYLEAAKRGLPRAQYELARLYDETAVNNVVFRDELIMEMGGLKDVKKLWAEASKWYEKAAASGDPTYIKKYADFLKYGSATMDIGTLQSYNYLKKVR